MEMLIILADARRIKKPREVGILECMYYMRPEDPLEFYVPQRALRTTVH